MIWDRVKMVALSEENARLREQAGERVERALLAYARAFGQTYEYNIDQMLARAELDVLVDDLTHDDLYVAHDTSSMKELHTLAQYKTQREAYLKGREALFRLFEGDALLKASPQELNNKAAAYEAERARADLEDDARKRLDLDTRRERRRGR